MKLKEVTYAGFILYKEQWRGEGKKTTYARNLFA